MQPFNHYPEQTTFSCYLIRQQRHPQFDCLHTMVGFNTLPDGVSLPRARRLSVQVVEAWGRCPWSSGGAGEASGTVHITDTRGRPATAPCPWQHTTCWWYQTTVTVTASYLFCVTRDERWRRRGGAVSCWQHTSIELLKLLAPFC